MNKIYDIIPYKKAREEIKIEKKSLKRFIDSLPMKAIGLWLVIAINWFGFLAIINTVAYFNDTESSTGNIYNATKLDFSLFSPADFLPLVTPTQTSSRNISVINEGILDFQYTVTATGFLGDLCNFLELTANLDGGSPEFFGTLISFNYDAGEFIPLDEWELVVNLTSDDPNLQNQTCTFDLVFYGTQLEGAGFYDQEIISNTVTSGEWNNPDFCFVINEVYYDPDEAHQGQPSEEKFEWIELYNTCDQTINLQNWYIEDNNGREIIHQSYPIDPYSFIVLAANAAVWNTYWETIPDNAFKIALGGNMMSDGLDNDGDEVFLYDNNNNQVDAVSWGTNTHAFTPSVPGAPEGYSIAREPLAHDTDTAADWVGLDEPNPGINPHSVVNSSSSNNEEETEEIVEETVLEAEETQPLIEETITEEPEEEEIPIEEIIEDSEEDKKLEETTTDEDTEETEDEVDII